jgi:hypothetical protein
VVPADNVTRTGLGASSTVAPRSPNICPLVSTHLQVRTLMIRRPRRSKRPRPALGLATLLALIPLAAGCGSSTSPAPTGTVSGVVSSALSGALANAYVVVTPASGVSLPGVPTSASGTYSVQRVPIGSGAGTVALSVYPDDCTPPAPVPYSGLASGTVVTANVTVACAPLPASIAGTIVNSAGGYISGATVTITPTGLSALPSVISQPGGTFLITGVTIGAGTGTVSVANLPPTCPVPAPVAYGGLAPGASITTIVTVSCTTSTALSLGVGQSAIFATGPNFQTDLVMPANSQYLITVVNTDTSSGVFDSFMLAGANPPSSMLVRGPLAGSQTVRSLRRLGPAPLQRAVPGAAHWAGLAGPTRSNAWFRQLERMQRRHMATLDFNRQVFARYGPPHRTEGVGGVGGVHASSLVGTKVGDVNKIYVNQLTGLCDAVDSISAQTVYVGRYVQVLADMGTWAARPDPSFYAAYGSEFDAVTYPHLLAYIGDPLAYDGLLSGVGKVTVVFTPLVNAGGDAGFVNGCDLYPRSEVQFSNVTEMIYGWTPDTTISSIDFWERDFRGVTAHEAKHIVSLSHHAYDGATSFEQSWLEESMAQQSAEIWMRHFDAATWRADANFEQTIGCEVDGSDPCYSASNPYFFSDRVFYELLHYLYDDSSNPTIGGFSFGVEGKYGGGWEFIRWATDVFAGSGEGNYIKALIDDPTYVGMGNVSQHSGLPAANLLVEWSLATAFDQTTLADSATFHPTDSLATVPSFDFRNIFAVAGSQDGWGFARAFPVNSVPVSGTFNFQVQDVNGTASVFFELSGESSASTESLQLQAQTGQPISPASAFRVGVIRVQ